MSEKLKINLDLQSAEALRTFAETMPAAVERIEASTERLVRVYNSVSDSLGVHAQKIGELVMLIKKAQEESAEAITVLPKMLKSTANRMDEYIATHPEISTQ